MKNLPVVTSKNYVQMVVKGTKADTFFPGGEENGFSLAGMGCSKCSAYKFFLFSFSSLILSPPAAPCEDHT